MTRTCIPDGIAECDMRINSRVASLRIGRAYYLRPVYDILFAVRVICHKMLDENLSGFRTTTRWRQEVE